MDLARLAAQHAGDVALRHEDRCPGAGRLLPRAGARWPSRARDYTAGAAFLLFGGQVARAERVGQAVADRSSHGAYAPETDSGIHFAPGQLELFLYTQPGNPTPTWVPFEPRKWTALDAAARSAVHDFSGQAARFRAFYGTKRWEELTRSYEDALGRALAEKPSVIAAARQAVTRVYDHEVTQHGHHGSARRFFPPTHPAASDYRTAMERLLDANSAANLVELMSALDYALMRDPVPRSRPVDKSSPDFHEVRSAGILVVNDQAHLAKEMLLRYRAVPGVQAADMPAFRQAVLAWLLPDNFNTLFEVLEASHEAGMGDVVEHTVMFGDATHLYEWADTKLAPREDAPASLRRLLLLPHHSHYFNHRRWLTPEVSGDGSVPYGIWTALHRGDEHLSETGNVLPTPGPPIRAWPTPRGTRVRRPWTTGNGATRALRWTD